MGTYPTEIHYRDGQFEVWHDGQFLFQSPDSVQADLFKRHYTGTPFMIFDTMYRRAGNGTAGSPIFYQRPGSIVTKPATYGDW